MSRGWGWGAPGCCSEPDEPGWGLSLPVIGVESDYSWGQLAAECPWPLGLGREGPAAAGGPASGGAGPAASRRESVWGVAPPQGSLECSRAAPGEEALALPPTLPVTPAPTYTALAIPSQISQKDRFIHSPPLPVPTLCHALAGDVPDLTFLRWGKGRASKMISDQCYEENEAG